MDKPGSVVVGWKTWSEDAGITTERMNPDTGIKQVCTVERVCACACLWVRVDADCWLPAAFPFPSPRPFHPLPSRPCPKPQQNEHGGSLGRGRRGAPLRACARARAAAGGPRRLPRPHPRSMMLAKPHPGLFAQALRGIARAPTHRAFSQPRPSSVTRRGVSSRRQDAMTAAAPLLLRRHRCWAPPANPFELRSHHPRHRRIQV